MVQLRQVGGVEGGRRRRLWRLLLRRREQVSLIDLRQCDQKCFAKMTKILRPRCLGKILL
jgi:hypothetical protein